MQGAEPSLGTAAIAATSSATKISEGRKAKRKQTQQSSSLQHSDKKLRHGQVNRQLWSHHEAVAGGNGAATCSAAYTHPEIQAMCAGISKAAPGGFCIPPNPDFTSLRVCLLHTTHHPQNRSGLSSKTLQTATKDCALLHPHSKFSLTPRFPMKNQRGGFGQKLRDLG